MSGRVLEGRRWLVQVRRPLRRMPSGMFHGSRHFFMPNFEGPNYQLVVLQVSSFFILHKKFVRMISSPQVGRLYHGPISTSCYRRCKASTMASRCHVRTTLQYSSVNDASEFCCDVSTPDYIEQPAGPNTPDDFIASLAPTAWYAPIAARNAFWVQFTKLDA